MRRIKLILALVMAFFCIGLLCPQVGYAANIRVLVNSDVTSATFTVTNGAYQVISGLNATNKLADLQANDVLTVRYTAGSMTLAINGKELEKSTTNVALLPIDQTVLNTILYKERSTQYRDAFSIMPSGWIVNVVDLEHYLYGVVGKELGPGNPTAAIAAQAVASRSYAASYIGSGVSYDVKSTTSSQVYGGYTTEKAQGMEQVVAAIDSTAGQVMYYTDSAGVRQLVVGYYSTHSGGYTENNENVWGGKAVPYLRGVPSPADSLGPAAYNDWTVSYSKQELAERMQDYMRNNGMSGTFGTLESFNVYTTAFDGAGNSASGRVTKVEAVGSKTTLTSYRDNIRSFLGVKSTLFTVGGKASGGEAMSDEITVLSGTDTKTKLSWSKLVAYAKEGVSAILGEQKSPSVISATGKYAFDGSTVATDDIVITGHGYGHGIGMSQWGAIGMAKQGSSYQDILQLYYGGTDPNGRLTLEQFQ